ncbi:MAG: hypothetical protein LCH36_12505 [Actinobacteria bacterium]|nr:hypothetical protein [Actinomycetota bacterium]
MTRQTIGELRGLRDLPYGTARTAATETLARKIEADGPQEVLAEALLDLVEAYTFSGEGAKSFVAFARLLRLWDESPELFDAADQRNLFWEFKWIAADLADFPQITPEQAEAFLADMQRRFELAGNGLSSVRMSRFLWAWWTGKSDVEQARLAWIGGERDEFEDCEACTIGNQTVYLTEIGEYAQAVALGITQRSSCNKEPACTHHATALAALMTGDPALALEQHKLALATTSDENRSIGQARAKCFEMLARGGRLHAALCILRNDDAAQLQGASSPLIQLRFLLSLLSGLSANLPEQADLETGLRAPEMRTVGALHAWAKAEAAQLVTRFDARNENDYYARRLARALSAEPAAQPLPAESSAIPDHAHSEGQPQAASAFESDRADGIYPAGSADSSLEHAETALSQKRYLVAAEHYAKAAGLFARDGWLERAGVAYADAAQSAASAGDDETSQRGFSAAVPLLQGGGAAPELLISVIAAWAPVAASLGRETEPLTALIELLPQLDHLVDSPGGELSDELADRRRRERAATSATARDTLARLIASADPACLPAGITRERAVHEAGRAGEAFAQLGRIADAAHAFWLAGKVQRELGQTNDAVWSLESAFEGFTVVRAKQQRTDVASELIELLRQTGQPERADEIALQLFT